MLKDSTRGANNQFVDSPFMAFRRSCLQTSSKFILVYTYSHVGYRVELRLSHCSTSCWQYVQLGEAM